MGILQGLIATIRQWDRPSQIALAIAFVLLLIDFVVLATLPGLRTPAGIGFVGLMIVIQGIMLWGNRLLVTPFTKAQRHFLNGEFEQTAAILQTHIAELEQSDKTPDVDVWVLLGNTYRNLGQLEASETALKTALMQRPSYHFALYGMGKTLLAAGRYSDALKHLQHALDNGAPAVIQFDLAHVNWRLGKQEVAIPLLARIDLSDEPYRELFAHYMRYTAGQRTAPDSDLISAGLPFWEAEIERTKDTPYGHALAHDVAVLREML